MFTAYHFPARPRLFPQAYADLVANLRWKSLVLVYENEESLIRLQELLKMPKSFDDVKIVLMQLPPDSTDYRPLLKQIKRSAETRIVVDCSFDKIEEILRQASETEIISDYHNFLFTSLVSLTVSCALNLDISTLDAPPGPC